MHIDQIFHVLCLQIRDPGDGTSYGVESILHPETYFVSELNPRPCLAEGKRVDMVALEGRTDGKTK